MSQNNPLILASSSPYKRRLMARLGVEFSQQSPDVDESFSTGEDPTALARRLAIKKADTVANDHPDALVLGSDQVIACGGEIFQKPQTRPRACEQLQQLQGKTHHLISAVALVEPDGEQTSDIASYQMVMRPLGRAQIQRYIDKDTPLDCAGSYKIEAAGIRLFEATRGDDPTAIEGLPLTRVWTLLLDAGYTDE